MNCPKCGAPLAVGSGFCSGCGTQLAAAGVPEKKGKSTVTCLIVVAVACVMAVPVIGIIAAIAIPNLLSSIQRGRQKRTMADMKTLSTAIESYNTDNNHYPVASNRDELCRTLTPDYLAVCIYKDGWYTPQNPSELVYRAWGGTPEGCRDDAKSPACGPRHYGLASAGKDGKFSASDFSGYDRRDTDTYNADIVIMDGQFVRTPSGRQRNDPGSDPFMQPPGAAPEDFDPAQK